VGSFFKKETNIKKFDRQGGKILRFAIYIVEDKLYKKRGFYHEKNH